MGEFGGVKGELGSLGVGFLHHGATRDGTPPRVVFSETFTIHMVFAIESRGAICTGTTFEDGP